MMKKLFGEMVTEELNCENTAPNMLLFVLGCTVWQAAQLNPEIKIKTSSAEK